MHRASDPHFPVLLQLETAPAGGRELKRIYNAETAEVAAKRLEEFGNNEWGKKLPAIVQSWRRVWDQVTPFFVYPADIRKIIYTTNAIESLHVQLRKILKSRGHFPSDEAATKLIYLAIRNIIRRGGKNPPAHLEAGCDPICHPIRRTIFPADAA
jgi:putative transposase